MPTDYQWKKIREEKRREIEKRVNIKDQNIAFFNSLNSAIALIKDKNLDKNEMKKMIVEWRDWFMDEWRAFYLSIMPVEQRTTPMWAKGQTKKAVKSELLNEEAKEHSLRQKEEEEIEKANALAQEIAEENYEN